MTRAVVILSLGCLASVSAWPKQSDAEIAEEAARDAAIYKKMMQFDVFGNRLQAASGNHVKRTKEGECKTCPDGQFFHKCNIAGMTEGHEYTCQDVAAYLHDGKTDKECDGLQSNSVLCCNASAPPTPEPACQSAPIPTVSPCTKHQQSIRCVDGFRPADNCTTPWTYDGKSYDGCYAGWTQTWCSHDADYTSASDSSKCEPCREDVNPDQPQGKWVPAFESIRCLYAIATSGDATERVMTFENGGPGTDNVFPVFSAGKWPTTVAIAGVVNAGYLTWDTTASELFDWWTKDTADPRSRITLANFMNFVDGFVNVDGISQFTHDPLKQRCLTPGVANFYTPEECAKQIYETASFAGVEQDTYMNATTPGAEPGTWFDYNSYHQQISMAMVVKASGMDARDLLKKYILDPAGMKDSYWLGGSNPCMSGFLQSTTDDYDSFLRAHTGYKIVPKSIADRTEKLVLGAEGSKVKVFGVNSTPFVRFENFAMGIYHQGGDLTMGGNMGNVMNRRTGHYSLFAYSGSTPYKFEVLMQVYNFHNKVEEIWAGDSAFVV